ncbi:MAG: DUF3833 domain-containing protein [Rhodospirillales bacterium]|nr:DUF3833 domain-containing protein [Rhodospirillales bacterium]
MTRRVALVLLSVLSITGCGSMKSEDFAGQKPHFVVEDYFSGQTRAWGIFEDRFGDVRAQFTVEIDGKWDGKELVLDEDFLYADGRTDRRVWTIAKIDDNTYQGRAADVIGVATGRAFGNALNWRYDIDLKVGGDKTYRVHFNDWMFLQPDGVLLNRARVTKWGIEVGEVTLVFAKNNHPIPQRPPRYSPQP